MQVVLPAPLRPSRAEQPPLAQAAARHCAAHGCRRRRRRSSRSASASFAKIDLRVRADRRPPRRACPRPRSRRNACTLIRSAKSSATSMSCSIMTIVTSRGMRDQQLQHVARARRPTRPANGSSSSSTLRVLRQRHGDFDPPALAVGRLRERAIGQMLRARRARARPARGAASARSPANRRERVPALRRQCRAATA